MAEIRLTNGKGDFVRRKTPNGIEDICLCKYNADISEGCISQVPSYLLMEVINNDGKYSEQTKEKWIKETGKLPDLRCTYCSAKRKNGKNIKAKDIGDKTKHDFEELKPPFIRLSKETEWGHPLYKGSLLHFLNLCTEHDSKIIFPTKMLAFDEEVAKMLIQNGGFLSFSIGNDRFEGGAVSYGFTNQWRIKQAEKYSSYGVNAALTIVLDVTSSIDENEEKGFNILEALNSTTKVKRIIPIRLTSGKSALETTGIQRRDLINPEMTQGYLKGLEKYPAEIQEKIIKKLYIKRENNDLIANFIHPDFSEFERELRICGQIGEYEYCDKCNLFPDRVKFHVSEVEKVDYSPNKSKLQNRRKEVPSIRKGIKKVKTKLKPKEKQSVIKFNEQR